MLILIMINIIIHSQETEGSHTGGTITTSMALNEALEVLDNEHEQNGNYNTLFRLYNSLFFLPKILHMKL